MRFMVLISVSKRIWLDMPSALYGHISWAGGMITPSDGGVKIAR